MASELNKLLNLIDETLHFVETSNEGKLIFITGRSAAGKTSLGEAFKTLDNFIHFDGDHFTYGFGDPILDAGKTFDGKKVKRNKEIQEAWGLASSKGFSAFCIFEIYLKNMYIIIHVPVKLPLPRLYLHQICYNIQ